MEMLKFGITIESHEECRQEPDGENTSIFKLLSGKMNFTKGNFILGRIYQKINTSSHDLVYMVYASQHTELYYA